MAEDDSNKKTTQGVREGAAVFDAARSPPGKALKVRRIGNSLGVVLPKEVLAKLRVGEGEFLNVVETPEGMLLSAFDDEVARQVEAGRGLMKRYRNALRELAK